MSPELKLKAAAEDIKDVLRKHDIGAAIVLHTPGHGEFLLHTNPSYSCAYQVEDSEIRFYAMRKDYKTLEEHQKKIADTANMMKILLDCTGINFMNLEKLSKAIDEKVNATHE